MKDDIMTVQFLPGGIVKITSPDAISPANHVDAEDIVKGIEEDAGGPVKITPLRKGHHGHKHTHSDGQTHTH